MDPTSSSFTISLATLEDISVLGHIAPLSMLHDRVEPYMFADLPACPSASTLSVAATNLVTNQLHKHLSTPNCRVFKACVTSTGEAVAHATITFHPEFKKKVIPETNTWPKGCREDFCSFFWGELVGRYNEVMKGRGEHVEWNSFFIHPDYQRMGLGSLMLRWAFHTFELEQQEIWLSSMLASTFYRSFGWEEICIIDIDLGDWSAVLGVEENESRCEDGGRRVNKNGKANDAYRVHCMLRRPGVLL